MAVYRVRTMRERVVQLLAAGIFIYGGITGLDMQTEVGLIMLGIGGVLVFLALWKFEQV